MKVFISWSGEHSHSVAKLLREWLKDLFSTIEPFVSSEDIRKGKRWPQAISGELEQTNFGMLCLTPDNLTAPWLLFEAGALSKFVEKSSVAALLLGGLKKAEVDGPLSHFQHTEFEKDDFFKLIVAINDAQGPHKQEEARLRRVFEKFWGDLESDVTKVLKVSSKPEKRRDPEAILYELHEMVTQIAKSTPRATPEPTLRPITADSAMIFADSTQPIHPESNCIWNQILQKVTSPLTRTSLGYAQGVIRDNTLVLQFGEEDLDHLSLIDNPRNVALLQRVMSDLGLKNYGVKFECFKKPRKGN